MAVKTHSKFVYVENPLIGLTPDSSALLSSPHLTFPHIYAAFESSNFSTLIDTKYVFIPHTAHAHKSPISLFSVVSLFPPVLSLHPASINISPSSMPRNTLILTLPYHRTYPIDPNGPILPILLVMLYLKSLRATPEHTFAIYQTMLTAKDQVCISIAYSLVPPYASFKINLFNFDNFHTIKSFLSLLYPYSQRQKYSLKQVLTNSY